MENISKLTPILYEKNETSFNHNGLGKLTKLLVNEIEEVLNGEFEAFFEYPVNAPLADKIDHEMFVKAKPNKKDEPHVFKIYDYEVDTISQTILIYARSKNIEDLRNNMILDVNVKNLAPTQAYNLAKNNALDPVSTTFYSDITTTSSVHWERRSLLSTIAGQEGSMIQYWGGEIKHTNGRVSLFRRRGQDNVTTVRHGKNLEGLKATYSTKGLVTAIVPYYSRNDDKSVYGSVVKSEYVNNYPNIYYDIVEYNDEELGLSREDEPEDGYSDATIRTALNNKAKNWFKENAGKDLPSINMEINLVDISQTKEYAHFKDFEQIEIGDTITVYAKKFNVNVNAKVRRVVYNGLTDMNEVVEVGTVRRSLYDDVRDDFKHDLNRVENELQEGIDHAMTSANGKNTNYHGTADPNEIGLVGQNNDNYFRTNGQLKELWIYRDGMWHLEVGDLTGQQIRAEVEQAQADIAEAQQTADEAVNRINGEIAGKFNDIDTEISQVHQDAQNALNQAGDAVSQVAYFGETLDGFTQTVANIDGRVANIRHDVDGITQTVTDQTDRIATVEQNVHGIQQTVSDPVNGLVTQVSTLASGFNVLAKDFEDLEIGGRNLLQGTSDQWITLEFREGRYYEEFAFPETILEVGKTYTFSVEVEKVSDDGAPINLHIGTGTTTYQKDIHGWRKNNIPMGERVTLTYTIQEGDLGNHSGIFAYRFRNEQRQTTIRYRMEILELGNKATDWTPAPEDMATQAQLSVLNDNINLRVEKGDVINQINISDESILLQANKIQALGDVVVDGKLTITDEFIAPNAQIDGAKIADATIGSAKIASLDVSKLVGNTQTFIQSNLEYVDVGKLTGNINVFTQESWNAISNEKITVDFNGIQSRNGSNGEYARIQEGGLNFYRPDTSGVGRIGSYYDSTRAERGVSVGLYSGYGFRVEKVLTGENRTLFDISANEYIRLGGTSVTVNSQFITQTVVNLNNNKLVVGDTVTNSNQNLDLRDNILYGASRVEVGSNIRFANDSHRIYDNSRTSLNIAADTNLNLGTNNNGSINTVMRVLSSGVQMFGVLNMQGQNITRVGELNYDSDGRLKDILGERTENDLATIMAINYKNYIMNGKKQRGFIAQELRLIDDELVIQNEDGYLGYEAQGYVHTIGHAVQQLAFREEDTNKVASQALVNSETNAEKIERLEKEIQKLKEVA